MCTTPQESVLQHFHLPILPSRKNCLHESLQFHFLSQPTPAEKLLLSSGLQASPAITKERQFFSVFLHFQGWGNRWLQRSRSLRQALTDNWPSCAPVRYEFQSHAALCQSNHCLSHRWSIWSRRQRKYAGVRELKIQDKGKAQLSF